MNTRYARQWILPEIGESGQVTLFGANVLVVGAGGLGSPVVAYLVASGVGHVHIVDHDVIELSNLHRQVFYQELDIDQSKAEVLSSIVNLNNSEVKVTSSNIKVEEDNIDELIQSADVVVDATDNYATRYLIHDTCLKQKKRLVFGAMTGFEGQLMCFDFTKPKSACYRCLFPDSPTHQMDNCQTIGAFGPLAGMLACMMASEVIKHLIVANNNESRMKPLFNQLVSIDLRDNHISRLSIPKKPNCTCN